MTRAGGSTKTLVGQLLSNAWQHSKTGRAAALPAPLVPPPLKFKVFWDIHELENFPCSSKIDNFRAEKLYGQNADFRNPLPATVLC